MKKKLSIILVLLLAVSLTVFTSCGDKEPEYGIHKNGSKISIVLPNYDKATELNAKIFDSMSGYSIVRPDVCDDETLQATLLMRDSLRDMGIDLPIASDWVKPGTDAPTDTLEIIIGETNRVESPAYHTLRSDDFLIKFENNRLVICGGSGASTMKAVECFLENFIDPETNDVLIPDGGEYLCRIGTPADSLVLNGVELCDWQIVQEAHKYPNAPLFLKDFIAESTHFIPDNKSENQIIINSNAPAGTCTVSVDGSVITVSGSDEVDATMAVRFFISNIIERSGFNTSKVGQKLSVNIDSTLSMTEAEFKTQEPYIIYVSPDGNDDNDGTSDAPLASLDGARLRVRKVMRLTTQPIAVEFLAGDYYVSEQVNFTANDSGTAIAPITYRAAKGAEVNFIGGLKVDPSLVSKAQDQSIVNRVLDKDAASKLMQIDLSSLLDEIPLEYTYGNTENNEVNPIQVYINENPLDRSRWPNANSEEKYARAKGDFDQNEDGSKTFYFNLNAIEHLKLWGDEVKKDLYMMTFFAHEWTNEVSSASKLDLKKMNVTFDGAIQYWDAYKGGGRYYFFNLPEEIDVPGESYIDRENRIIYFLPEDDYDANEIFVSTMVETMIVLTDVQNLIFDGINFTCTRGNIFSGTGVNNIIISNNIISHTSSNAITVDGTKISIIGNHIFDTARGGIIIRGGDRVNLISSENLIENNEIHDINRDEYPYKPGVYTYAIGTKIRHNKMYNCAHMMISISTNDVIVEYNEIYNCALEAADMGAIYTGRNPSLMGNVIRYNYFHDIGNTFDDENGQQAIFNDDGNNGLEIYGNVFWKATYNKAAVKSNGAQFMHMYNNIFVDMPYAFSFNGWINSGDVEKRSESWFLWLYDRKEGTNHGIPNLLRKANFDSELWREHYKDTIWAQLYKYVDSNRLVEYTALTDAEIKAIAAKEGPIGSNVLERNIMVNINKGDALKYYYGSGETTVDANYVTMDNGIFKEYGVDFSLTDEALAEIRKTIPDFEEIPFEKIGLLD